MEEEIPFKEKIKHVYFGTPRKPKSIIDRQTDTKHVERIHEDTGEMGGVSSYKGDGSISGKVLAQMATPTESFKEEVQQGMRDAVADSKPGKSVFGLGA